MLVHTLEAEGLVITKITLIPLSEHVEVIYVFSQLDFRVERSFASFAVVPLVYIVVFELVYREWGVGHEALHTVRASEPRYFVVFGLDVKSQRAHFVVLLVASTASVSVPVASVIARLETKRPRFIWRQRNLLIFRFRSFITSNFF